MTALLSGDVPAPGIVSSSTAPRNAENSIRVFCFSHDWFDNGIAPYGVWRVDNGTLVIPDNPHAGMLQYAARADFAQRVAAWKEFNAAIVEYAFEFGGDSVGARIGQWVHTLELAFDNGGYKALGDFDGWSFSLA